MNKTDNTIKELKKYIEELKKEFTKKAKYLDDNKKEIAEDIVDKTIAAINLSIEKITVFVKTVKDDERVNALLDTVKAKSKEAIDYAIYRIENLGKNEPKDSLDIVYDEIMNEFDKLKETEFFKTTKVLVKEGYGKLNEFLEKPEVQEKIKTAKVTTIKYAEKGVEGLKKVLDVDNTKKKTKTKKAAIKKTAAKKATKKTTKAKTTKKKTNKTK